MRMTIKHPTNKNLTATVGFDRTSILFFIDVFKKGALIDEYSGLTAEEPSTLKGVLDRLVTHGFFGPNGKDAVYEALELLPHVLAEEIKNKNVRMAAEVIQKLKEAGSD